MGATEKDLEEINAAAANMTAEEIDHLHDLLEEREKAKRALEDKKTKDAVVRSKKLLFKKRLAQKGHVFYIVEAVKGGQKYYRLIELSALPTKKHEEAVFEELEAFLLKDMGISVPSEF